MCIQCNLKRQLVDFLAVKIMFGKHFFKSYLSSRSFLKLGNKFSVDFLSINFQLRSSLEKKREDFRGFNGIRTRGLCVRAAVLYAFRHFILSLQRERRGHGLESR